MFSKTIHFQQKMIVISEILLQNAEFSQFLPETFHDLVYQVRGKIFHIPFLITFFIIFI